MAKKKPTPPEPMAVETVPIGSIHLDPANVRKHPDRNLAAIKASLARFGQQKPIVVDANDVVRAGNGTLLAARELGWTEIKIVRSGLAGSEATAYAIADNRTSDLGGFDDAALAETLRSLQSEDFDLEAVGYTADEIDAMLEPAVDEESVAAVKLKKLTASPPPKMAWVLIAVPLAHYGRIDRQVRALAATPGVRCETVTSDIEPAGSDDGQEEDGQW